MRYIKSDVVLDNNKKRRLSSTIIQIPNSDQDLYIRVTSRDRLDKLAMEFYGNSSLWWIIANANGLGKGTYVIPRNTILRIPPKENIQQVINDINSNE